MDECNCGFGGFHDDANPRCNLYGKQAPESKWEAIRQTVPCPTCGGVGKRADPDDYHRDIPCPTCGGERQIRVAKVPGQMHVNTTHQACPTCKDWMWHPADTSIHKAGCPDCADGRIDMARLLAVGAAVFNATTLRQYDDEGCLIEVVNVDGERLSHVVDLLHELRKVRP